MVEQKLTLEEVEKNMALVVIKFLIMLKREN